MTCQPKRRWLPRFGLKSLFALVLVVAVYFGSWPPFRETAHYDVETEAETRTRNDLLDAFPGGNKSDLLKLDSQLAVTWFNPSAVAPYVIGVDEVQITKDKPAELLNWRRRYYLWLFGWTVRLPITTDE